MKKKDWLHAVKTPNFHGMKVGVIIFGIQHKYNKTEHRYNIAKEIHRVITLQQRKNIMSSITENPQSQKLSYYNKFAEKK